MKADAVGVGSRSLRVRRLLDSRGIVGLLLNAPASITVAAVLAFPIGYAFWLTIVDFQPALGSGAFVGVENYLTALADPDFHSAAFATAEFAIPATVGAAVVGLVMALILHEPFPGRSIVRSLIMVPWAMGTIVVGMIWGWIFNSSFGILNRLLEQLGLMHSPVAWLGSASTAPFVVAFVFAWAASPIATLLFLAALQSIPVELYRAAAADGAGALGRLFYVTIPLLRPTTLLVMIILTVDTLTAFGLIYVLTEGGPGTATTTFAWLAYQQTFRDFNFSGGTVTYFLVSALIVILGIAYSRLFRTGGLVGRDA